MREQKREAFARLVDEGFTRNGLAFAKQLAAQIYEKQADKPIVDYLHFEDEKIWKAAFFGREAEKQLLLEACPLSRSGNQYRFLHKSLLEYLVARAVFEPPEATVASEGASARRPRRDSEALWLSFESQEVLDEKQTPDASLKALLESPLGRKNLIKDPSLFWWDALAKRRS